MTWNDEVGEQEISGNDVADVHAARQLSTLTNELHAFMKIFRQDHWREQQ